MTAAQGDHLWPATVPGLSTPPLASRSSLPFHRSFDWGTFLLELLVVLLLLLGAAGMVIKLKGCPLRGWRLPPPRRA